MAVTLEGAALTTGDQQHFGVGFEAHNAINHLHADRFKFLCPIDVGLFVKSGFELHHGRDFFATPHRFSEQIHHGRIAACTVNGLLDRQDVGVHDRFTQKGQHTIEGLKGLVNHHIASFEAGEN